ncbi:small ribosomal subunit protein eS7-like [Ruditapes philippinarum]|uniref:small ribosomal subunit protein eS7-like n=1 Tax=Ruditapes philippinarum TaxID=129788 RepID=UPI00295A8EBC|nr:small ribosomal subunit protein eS7-like [Ruditapes philippinarum]
MQTVFPKIGENSAGRKPSGEELMYSARAKIVKPPGEKPDEFESSISQMLQTYAYNFTVHNILIFTGDRCCWQEGHNYLCAVPQLKSYQKIQTRLVRELEKKFSGKHVVFIAQRRILPKPTRKTKNKQKQKRPRSRTLTAVHECILDDLCFPSEIVGKRIRIKLDGSRLIKVHLEKTQQTNIEHKLDTFTAVYKKLTGKDVNFEFPE